MEYDWPHLFSNSHAIATRCLRTTCCDIVLIASSSYDRLMMLVLEVLACLPKLRPPWTPGMFKVPPTDYTTEETATSALVRLLSLASVYAAPKTQSSMPWSTIQWDPPMYVLAGCL
jgi:hypothetical protein